ncbi:hypothetical protein M8Z33_01945 [Streptomyces sp. ZAF1911]|uniref:hypothetical protein n=1 Tax=Streptomyces sp. ZAF1911 TaxID=2944129 RepID=UPI00237AA738|nr:hypothetical protein [Streptomyces sp. ZAF1911]MDD9375450.1 hypothetical protein [Streptomyces sp. ZAF1911]
MSAARTGVALDARQAGQRVDEVLDRLAATGDRAACAAAEELVRGLMEFYGAGLARITERLGDHGLAPLLDDELVASLLALHDLNPEDVHLRIGRALRSAPEQTELLGFDPATGVLRLSIAAGGGCGCGSEAGTDGVPRGVADALAAFAPEVTSVEVEKAAPAPALLQIGARPQTPARVR